MFVPLISSQLSHWKDYDLILPAVSYGNVGQLAVDLFVTSLKPQCVGHFYSPCVLPIVGSDPYSSNNNDITTNIKVYECEERSAIIIQQRSQVIYGEEDKFIKALTEFIKTYQFKRVIMLSSATSQYFSPEDRNSCKLYYLCTSVAKSATTKLEDENWKEFNVGSITGKDQEHMIPGGGISNLFLNACEINNISLIITIVPCWEGDNRLHALHYGDIIYNWLFQTTEGCSEVIPPSWNSSTGITKLYNSKSLKN